MSAPSWKKKSVTDPNYQPPVGRKKNPSKRSSPVVSRDSSGSPVKMIEGPPGPRGPPGPPGSNTTHFFPTDEDLQTGDLVFFKNDGSVGKKGGDYHLWSFEGNNPSSTASFLQGRENLYIADNHSSTPHYTVFGKNVEIDNGSFITKVPDGWKLAFEGPIRTKITGIISAGEHLYLIGFYQGEGAFGSVIFPPSENSSGFVIRISRDGRPGAHTFFAGTCHIYTGCTDGDGNLYLYTTMNGSISVSVDGSPSGKKITIPSTTREGGTGVIVKLASMQLDSFLVMEGGDVSPEAVYMDYNSTYEQIYVTSQFSGSLTMDDKSVPSKGMVDVFVASVDREMECVWLTSFGDMSKSHFSTRCHGIVSDPRGIYLLCEVRGKIDMDGDGAPEINTYLPSVCVIYLTTGGKYKWYHEFKGTSIRGRGDLLLAEGKVFIGATFIVCGGNDSFDGFGVKREKGMVALVCALNEENGKTVKMLPFGGDAHPTCVNLSTEGDRLFFHATVAGGGGHTISLGSRSVGTYGAYIIADIPTSLELGTDIVSREYRGIVVESSGGGGKVRVQTNGVIDDVLIGFEKGREYFYDDEGNIGLEGPYRLGLALSGSQLLL